jgi:hypothetical protein
MRARTIIRECKVSSGLCLSGGLVLGFSIKERQEGTTREDVKMKRERRPKRPSRGVVKRIRQDEGLGTKRPDPRLAESS